MIAKSEKTAKDAKSAKERSIKNRCFYWLLLFFLGVLGALGGSKNRLCNRPDCNPVALLGSLLAILCWLQKVRLARLSCPRFGLHGCDREVVLSKWISALSYPIPTSADCVDYVRL